MVYEEKEIISIINQGGDEGIEKEKETEAGDDAETKEEEEEGGEEII